MNGWHICHAKTCSLFNAYMLDILFTSNHNVHKSLCGLCFWTSDPSFDGFYQNLSIKGSEAQKQRPNFYGCCDLTKKIYLVYVLD